MNNKLKITIAVVITAVITFTLTNVLNGSLQVLDNVKMKEAMTVFSYTYNGDVPDREAMTDGAISGILELTNDPYTNYYNKEDFKRYLEDVQGNFVGLGVVVTLDNDGYVTVVAPYEDTPAYRAGMLTGDKIIKVDGEDLNGNLDRAVYLMKGQDLKNPEGTDVVVTIRREGMADFDVTMTREVIHVKSVTSHMLDDGVGYLKITSFDEDTDEEFEENVKSLQKSGMSKLVIDLRNNPGGDFDVVCKIADSLLGESVITYTENKKGEKVYQRSDAEMIDCPVAVLINQGSASASEVLTGALKDNKRAVVVGETSYGKGIVQSVFKLSDGSGMSVTTDKYFTPSGVCIHGIGIQPDVEVQMEIAAIQPDSKDDVQLQKAIEMLLQ